MIKATKGDVVRFMSYVEVLPSGCWYWNGARSKGKGNKKWYGSFRMGKATVRAHRFACDVIKGTVCPPEHHRDHLCRFSLCVNPEHLEIVPKKTNQDRKTASENPEAVAASLLINQLLTTLPDRH